MISFEIRVNGSLIAAINCINRGAISMDTERGAICEYEYGSTTFAYDLIGAPVVKHGTLHHSRRDGALVLARDLFARIIEDKPAPWTWSSWQPIDTLPDGEYVLLRFAELPHPVVGNSEFWSYKSGGFRATGWMRLPPS